jgi:Cu-Zn family superoxide dismutase
MMAVRTGLVAMLMPFTLLDPGATLTKPDSVPIGRGSEPVLALGRFQSYTPGQAAVTYDPKTVPEGAAAAVAYLPAGEGRANVQLRVSGLVPNRKYGAHVHTNRCGPKPEDAGPHYQHQKDPVTPATNPKYANPRNEVWLDFTTDARGNGFAQTTQDWKFGDRHPHSVVIHTEHTHTEPGHAGTAGARLACINVDF